MMREGHYRFVISNPLILPNVGGALGLMLGTTDGLVVGDKLGDLEGGFVVLGVFWALSLLRRCPSFFLL